MPTLSPNKAVTQTSPTLAVTNRFAPGRYLFELSVLDNAGNASAPTSLVVTVRGDGNPRVRVDPRLRRRITPAGPSPIPIRNPVIR